MCVQWGVTTTDGVCFRVMGGGGGRGDERMRAGVNVCAMGRDHDWGLFQVEGGR